MKLSEAFNQRVVESKPHSSQLELEDVVDVQVVARMQEESKSNENYLLHLYFTN